jgi:excinuclease ABC subunit A
LEEIKRGGFVRVRIDGIIYKIELALENPPGGGLDKNKKHTIEVVVDRLVSGEEFDRTRLVDSI